jgi:GNAT superfamily N-acetyltransferase
MDAVIHVSLANRTPVIIRPVRPEDKARIVNGMRQLSAESRHLRFFTENAELSPEMLRYLTEVDQQNHVAWIALDASTPEEGGVGIARFVRLPKEPTVAEFALTIIDSCRSMGLGRHLLNVLRTRAKEVGVNTFRAEVLPENHLMIDWLNRMGATSRFRQGVYEFEVPIASPAAK